VGEKMKKQFSVKELEREQTEGKERYKNSV